MRVFSIAWKDFRHTYRDIAGLALMIVAPLLLATALGAAFGAGGNFAIAPVRTVLANEDAGEAGSHVANALASSGLADLLIVDNAETAQAARNAVDNGEADVAVIVPSGLTQAIMAQGGAPADVAIYSDPALTVGPAIVSAVVRSVVQALDGARAAAAASAQLAVSLGEADQQQIVKIATRTAEEFSGQIQGRPPVSFAARAPVVAGSENRREPNVASQVLLGMMIFFTFFGAATPARSILDEHRSGTLSRLFSTPTRRVVILGGKYVAVFLVVLVQSVILLLAGRLFFGAHWGAIGPVVVLTLCGAIVAASLGLLTVSFAKTAGQAGAVSSAIFVFLGLIGGNFVGGISGGTFALVRRFTPNGWLLEGWDHVLYGGSWEGMYVQALSAFGFAVVFFAAATFFFRRRYA